MNPTSGQDQPKPKRGLFRGRRNHEPTPEQTPANTDQPVPIQDDEAACTNPNCILHGTNGLLAQPPFAMPAGHPFGGLLAAVKRAAETPAPRPARREWSPMFADEVNVGDLIGASAGMFGGTERELKVCKIRPHRGNDEDPLAPYYTLLLTDTVSGEVFSPTVSAQQGFRVAPAVPDSPAFLSGGA
jgi:hypothetical protein